MLPPKIFEQPHIPTLMPPQTRAGRNIRLFLSLCFLLIAMLANGQENVKVIQQRFDFQNFRFDITLKTSKLGLKLVEVGFYNFGRFCTMIPVSATEPITIKAIADYRLKIPWVRGFDTVIEQAVPMLDLQKDKEIRITLGFINEPTQLLSKRCIQLSSQPILIFSDSSRVVLEEEIFDSEDFLDYNEKERIPSDQNLQSMVNDKAPNIRRAAARVLCKSTLPKAALIPIIDTLLDDPDKYVQARTILSIGRLRYSEYTKQIANRFIKTSNEYEAEYCLRALQKLHFSPLNSLVIARFDTCQLKKILNVCIEWLEVRDVDRLAYKNIIAKIKSQPLEDIIVPCLPLVKGWKIKETSEALLGLITQRKLDYFSRQAVEKALVEFKDIEIAQAVFALVQQYNGWPANDKNSTVYESLLSIVVGYSYAPSIPLLMKLLKPDQSKHNLFLTINILNYKTYPIKEDTLVYNYFQALKPSIVQLIIAPNIPLDIKTSCLPFYAKWKYKEATDYLFNLMTSNPKSESYEIEHIYTALVEFDDTTIAVRAQTFLQEHQRELKQPNKQELRNALLGIVIGYAYMPSIPMVKDLLRQNSSADFVLNSIEDALGSEVLNKEGGITPFEASELAYFQLLKPSILQMINSANEENKEKALRMYCMIVRPEDSPSREDIVRKFLKEISGVDQWVASDLASKYNLTNLAPDICNFYRKSDNVRVRGKLKTILKDWEYACE